MSSSIATTFLRPKPRRLIHSSAMFSRLWSINKLVTTPTPKFLPDNVAIEEEVLPGYEYKHFYHPNPGEIVDGRFELKAKLGWGSTSTVWLAQDCRWRLGAKPYVAIKFNNNNSYDEATNSRELDISTHIVNANSEHSGRRYIRTVDDSFELAGPHGTHLCLVFEPMREPTSLLRQRLGGGTDKVTREFLVFFKMYIIVLLNGLEYLHTKCQVIHTDLKLDNILFTVEGRSVIQEYDQIQVQEPMPRKVYDGHNVYLSHNDFGPLRHIGKPALLKMCPKIADFGLAQRGDGDEPLIHPIQSNHYRAPEVILGIGWSYSADIWNFGVMVWDLLAGESMFKNLRDEVGAYSARHHLAEMIALLGPIPPELIEREEDMQHWRWAPDVVNSKGKVCNNAADYYSGPFFDDDGEFVGNDLIPRDRVLGNILPDCIADEEKELFLSFMKDMLCWIPEERATAEKLQKHPWLDISRE